MTLHEWILTAVAGPMLVLFGVAAGRAVIRARSNEERIKALEATVGGLETLPRELAEVRTQQQSRIKAEDEATQRNDRDHEEIKRSARETRREMLDAIRQLKTDLIREFRNSNGRKEE